MVFYKLVKNNFNIKIKTLVTTTQSKNFYFHFEATNELQQVFYNNFNMIVEL